MHERSTNAAKFVSSTQPSECESNISCSCRISDMRSDAPPTVEQKSSPRPTTKAPWFWILCLVALVFLGFLQFAQLSGWWRGGLPIPDKEQRVYEFLDLTVFLILLFAEVVFLLLFVGSLVLYIEVKARIEETRKLSEELELRRKQVLEESELRRKEVADIVEYGRAVPRASASLALALEGRYPWDAKLAVQRLLHLRKRWPTDRYLNLDLGRLYKALSNLETNVERKKSYLQEAIHTMSVFIRNKIRAGETTDTDIGDAYYNRSCYNSLLWKVAAAEEKGGLERKIKRDLIFVCYSFLPWFAASICAWE